MAKLEDYLPKSAGLRQLDASKVRLTGDPEYPIAYTNKEGVEHRLHKSRVMHLPPETQSPQQEA